MTRADFARIPELRKLINKELILWENAQESATNISYMLTGMPHGSSVSSKVENAVVKADEHYEKYTALCDELRDIWMRLKRDIVRCGLSEEETKVINMYYPQGKKVPQIAKEMNGITERHVWRLKQSALKKLCVDG